MNNIRLTFIFIYIFNSISFAIANEKTDTTLYIYNQITFNNLGTTINNIINNDSEYHKQDIKIILKNGTYRFKQGFYIEQKQNTYKNISIEITAETKGKVNILSGNKEINKSDSIDNTDTHYIVPLHDYTENYSFIDKQFNNINLSTSGFLHKEGINFTEEKPMVIDSTNLLMKIRIPKELLFIKNKNKDYFKHSWLYFTTQWFDSKLRNLYTDESYIYGNYSSQNAIEGGFYDENYKRKTRLYITNIPDLPLEPDKISIKDNYIYIPHHIDSLYICYGIRLLTGINLNLKKLEISNINFMGNGYMKKDDMIRFVNCNNIYITNNTFQNIGSKIIGIEGKNWGYNQGKQEYTSNNINIINNIFKDNGCSVCKIRTVNEARILNNYSENSGINTKNYTFLISCKNFLFQNNIVKNFPCNALYLSDTRSATNTISGIVENNEFFNTEEYNSLYKKNSMIDVGIIYGGAHNDNIIIRNNSIHDYKGYANYRGIFMDSGAYNVTVENNLVYNINSSFLVDLRYVSPIKNQIRPTATGNLLKNNIILGGFRWMGNPNYINQSTIEGNYTNVKDNSKIITKNAMIASPIIYENNITIENGKINLPLNIKKDFSDILFLKKFIK